MAANPTKRLCAATVAELPGSATLPYDRESMVPGLVHLGVGAFHRAHQAVFHHKALLTMSREDASKWGIVGVSLRSPGVRDQLAPQDCLYTVHERGSKDTNWMLVGCLKRCLVAPEDPDAVLALLASPTVRVVTLTVTEKGYCYQPATRLLDMTNADIAHDLLPENQRKPRSAIGFLVQALKMRREASVEPFTVVSCDNLPHNGATLAGICAAFAAKLDAEGDLTTWIAKNVCFPSSMVDCIVPATKETDIAKASADDLGGLRDEAMVVCEPFRQWVIQDAFGSLGRPPWEVAGAQIVKDVAAFEDAKLSILNGCHSMLAYSGFLCGIEFIWQVMEKDVFQELCLMFLECDVIPVLAPPEGVDLKEYAKTVLSRFKNSALEHRTSQIAMDGSQKIPQRFLKTARRNLECKSPRLKIIPLAIAAWMRYATRLEENGTAIRIQDPLADTFASIAVAAKGDARSIATSLFAIEGMFGNDSLVQAKEALVEPTIGHLQRLLEAKTSEATLSYLCEFVRTSRSKRPCP